MRSVFKKKTIFFYFRYLKKSDNYSNIQDLKKKPFTNERSCVYNIIARVKYEKIKRRSI